MDNLFSMNAGDEGSCTGNFPALKCYDENNSVPFRGNPSCCNVLLSAAGQLLFPAAGKKGVHDMNFSL